MSSLQNDRFLRALLREPVDVTPVWMMRQAGRYLPEYRATREKAGDFLSLCKNPELACEVTLQPLERFPLDAAILFSDILTVPDAMGLGLYFEEGEGPRFERPVRDMAAIEALPVPDPEEELRYVMDAVRTIRAALNGRVPLIGFSGSPWTLATYMVEGGSTKNFALAKGMMFDRPEQMHALLDKLHGEGGAPGAPKTAPAEQSKPEVEKPSAEKPVDPVTSVSASSDKQTKKPAPRLFSLSRLQQASQKSAAADPGLGQGESKVKS